MSTKPDISPFLNRISTYIKARVPIIYVITWEEQQLMNAIRSIVNSDEYIKDDRKIFEWSVTKGIVSDGKPVNSGLLDFNIILNHIEEYKGDAIFVLKDLYSELSNASNRHNRNQAFSRKVKDLVHNLKNSRYRKTIIVPAYDKFIPDDLQKDIVIEELDLPNEAQLRQILDRLIEDNRGNTKLYFEKNKQIVSQLCNAALGLTSAEAENAFALALVHDGRIDEADIRYIINEKKQIIKQSGVLEFSDTKLNMEDVGGLENLKEWLGKRSNTWSEEAQAYNLPNPKGLLITGVPGCGKSLTAKAVNSMWNLPLLKLDIGSLFDGLVGSSERNMRNAIATAEAVSPCVLWIDEIEKAFAGIGGSGDSGTSTRVFGTFLTWMQDKSKFVFVIATANKIDSLPPELMRKGRFDEIFFVDLPMVAERREIIKIHLKKRINEVNAEPNFIDDTLVDELIERTEGFTGSEIEELIISGLFNAYSDRRKVKAEDFYDAIDSTVPLYVTQKREVEALRTWAKTRAVSASQGLGDRAAQVQEFIRNEGRSLEI